MGQQLKLAMQHTPAGTHGSSSAFPATGNDHPGSTGAKTNYPGAKNKTPCATVFIGRLSSNDPSASLQALTQELSAFGKVV